MNSTSATGTPAITGKVYESLSPWPGLAGWCVQLTGTISGSAVTDANGNYVFTGLPDGTYTVCEVLQSGWVQTSPSAGTSCPTGFGYTFNIVISAGQSASFVNFGNAPATP